MTPVIQQSARFRISPEALFDLYLDSRRHSLFHWRPRCHQPQGGRKIQGI
jgi:hypothetical protein